MTSPAPPRLLAESEGDSSRLRADGRWTVADSAQLESQLGFSIPSGRGPITLDASGITALDTAGALALTRIESRLKEAGRPVTIEGLDESRAPLLRLVTEHPPSTEPRTPVRPGFLERLAVAAEVLADRAFGFLSFVGDVFLAGVGQILRPSRIRWAFVVRNLQTAGADALPIVGLLSFLIGVVIAYQGAVQLHLYGADIFIVDLVGLSIVRELAPLMTAIIVAGRTGSAYTAQIGTMKVTEEVDALEVLAMSPIEVLVLPKVFALVIALPLLTAYADFVGILGGVLMTRATTTIGPSFFFEQFPRVVLPESYLVGIGKAPVFAAVIATVGCYQGFQASASAESVGARTTTSVVQSIFLIIVLDALFSIAFSIVGI